MGFDYSRLQSTADRLITRFGAPATLYRLPALTGAPSDGDGPQNPWEVEPIGGDDDPTTIPDPVPMQIPVIAVDKGATTRYSRDDSGALLPRTVRVVLIAAKGVAPQMGDRIELADGMHEIARVNPVKPGDTALLFEVEVAA
ncbi:hypothetical protein PARHAE_02061 [Paracoccus haematequi]|uniref:Uncharacterized protein n=1 Tax=Paracoccus haematequi TaxID=2491866 RepID=A0A447IMZ8_9RHOB|nr:hypothetical protein [Paracoccus haematequi]VDS08876.1 hypothetical protein PARHAE_02061 [Paracoccus haematequi]